ncbi:phosphatase PAP2 family protein [Pseudonocardia parietis]|uniref:Undecaprenyl-diphosphatase n=1 Tax=Pseudonocardia parietis TaxID=570936 RepID=A0ABS4VR58_9PSEU|nr:phosphatase PAP2 family protein [Pseudonocardia parietis]MBP2366406.1 undecaprenyl-diphosphatase [Pseudonocardia parietis]
MISIPDVPDGSAAWLTRILQLFEGAPPWTGAAVELAGELALLLGLAVWFRAWLRSRTAGPRTVATALAAPVAVALTWPVSELAKQIKQVDRPCRLLEPFPSWADCPAPGDWSFPSNHAALAGALVVGVLLLALRLRSPVVALFALLTGLAAAVARVLTGAHFPHDVVAGSALGGMVALVTVSLLGSRATPLVARLRTDGRVPALVGDRPADRVPARGTGAGRPVRGHDR